VDEDGADAEDEESYAGNGASDEDPGRTETGVCREVTKHGTLLHCLSLPKKNNRDLWAFSRAKFFVMQRDPINATYPGQPSTWKKPKISSACFLLCLPGSDRDASGVVTGAVGASQEEVLLLRRSRRTDGADDNLMPTRVDSRLVMDPVSPMTASGVER